MLTECLDGLQGDKVKFTLQFRGREMQYKEDGQQMLQVTAVYMPTGATATRPFYAGVAQAEIAELRVQPLPCWLNKACSLSVPIARLCQGGALQRRLSMLT